MGTAIVLLILSALLGIAISLRFKIQAVAVLSILIAFSSAITLRTFGFGLTSGILVTIACVTACQMSYILGVYLHIRLNQLVKNDPGHEPCNDRQDGVGDQKEGEEEKPPGFPAASTPASPD